MSQLRSSYLFFYNLVQASGWALSLFRILSNLSSSKSTNGAFSSAGELICILQSLAFLEVIHGAVGIVPSGVLLPLMQWGGRTHFLFAIVRRIPEVQELPSVFITFVAWGLSETASNSLNLSFVKILHERSEKGVMSGLIKVIRYSHYALYCIGSSPKWITLIRYNAFIVLYPIGVFPGEMWLMYQGLLFIKKENLYADSLPFSYYNFMVVLLFCYPFLWLKLYLHLFKQRRSKLGKEEKKKRN